MTPISDESALTRRQFLRRGALATGGLALGSSVLVECSRTNAREGGGSNNTDKTTVRISSWPLYIAPGTTADFERATGIHASYAEDVNDNVEYFAKIAEPLARGQSIDRDVVVLSDWLVARMIRLGYCAPLDDGQFPNKSRLIGDLGDANTDQGHTYSVPYLSGMAGIAYNPKTTGRELTSVSDLFDPAFKGRVTMLTEMRDTVGLVLLGEGRDPANVTTADVEAACTVIEKYRRNGQVRAFTGNDYAADLASGNIAAAMAWSGDIAGLAADNPDLKWIAPKEGGMLISDCMFIPKTSDRVGAAMAWMNYLYQPAVSARIVQATLYLSPVRGALAELTKIAPKIAASPLVNPPDDMRARLHVFRTLGDDEDQQYNRLFRRAIGT